MRYTPPLEPHPSTRDGLDLRGFDGDIMPVDQNRPLCPRRALEGNIELGCRSDSL